MNVSMFYTTRELLYPSGLFCLPFRYFRVGPPSTVRWLSETRSVCFLIFGLTRNKRISIIVILLYSVLLTGNNDLFKLPFWLINKMLVIKY